MAENKILPCADIWPKDGEVGPTGSGIFMQQVPPWTADSSSVEARGAQGSTRHRQLPPPAFVTTGSLVSWAQG